MTTKTRQVLILRLTHGTRYLQTPAACSTQTLAVVLLACASPSHRPPWQPGNWGGGEGRGWGCLSSTEGAGDQREKPATGHGRPGVSHTGGGGTRYSAEFSGDAAFPRLTDLLGNGVVHDGQSGPVNSTAVVRPMSDGCATPLSLVYRLDT